MAARELFHGAKSPKKLSIIKIDQMKKRPL
jgi:hypothetical protein